MAARKLNRNEDDLWHEFKRQSIQQAVVRLMCREGLQSVTMDRVAQEVGIAKGTVYLHYRDKQELLDAVKESSLEPLVAKLDDVFRGAAAADRKLQAYALRYLTYFDERRDLFRILLYEREVTRVHGSRYQTDRYRRLLDGVESVIRDGISKGVFREVDPRLTAAMYVESNMAIMNQRLSTETPNPVEDDAETISEMFLRGLRVAEQARRTA